MVKYFKAVTESFGFQGQHWLPGNAAIVTEQELNHPSLVPTLGQFVEITEEACMQALAEPVPTVSRSQDLLNQK